MKNLISTAILSVFLISFAQNHPNSLSISNTLSRWDGEYPLTFAVLGDNYGMYHRFYQIAHQINDLDTLLDFVITTGDHTSGGDSVGYYEYISLIDSIRIPWITVMGNHEINDSLGWDRFLDYLGYPDFYFDIGNARFIALTDCHPASTIVSGMENVYYKFTSEQLDWLEARLSEWDGYKFVLIHAPPYLQGHIIVGTLGSFGFSPGYEESLTERFTDILRDYNVYVCFCGHIHVYDRWTPNNEQYGDVSYIITGGAGGELGPWYYGAPTGGSFYHFLIMQLYEDGTLVEHLVHPDTIDDGVFITEYDSVYEWTFYPPTAVMSAKIIPENIAAPYPNPFNSSITIPVPSGRKNIEIRDCAGRIVSVIPSSRKNNVIWHPDNSIKSGIYLTDNEKIILIR